jgi:hypothetical protein
VTLTGEYLTRRNWAFHEEIRITAINFDIAALGPHQTFSDHEPALWLRSWSDYLKVSLESKAWFLSRRGWPQQICCFFRFRLNDVADIVRPTVDAKICSYSVPMETCILEKILGQECLFQRLNCDPRIGMTICSWIHAWKPLAKPKSPHITAFESSLPSIC